MQPYYWLENVHALVQRAARFSFNKYVSYKRLNLLWYIFILENFISQKFRRSYWDFKNIHMSHIRLKIKTLIEMSIDFWFDKLWWQFLKCNLMHGPGNIVSKLYFTRRRHWYWNRYNGIIKFRKNSKQTNKFINKRNKLISPFTIFHSEMNEKCTTWAIS